MTATFSAAIAPIEWPTMLKVAKSSVSASASVGGDLVDREVARCVAHPAVASVVHEYIAEVLARQPRFDGFERVGVAEPAGQYKNRVGAVPTR